MALTIAQIQNAYVAFFNRPADVAGLQYWSSYAGNSADLLNTFAESAEYKDLYAGMNSTQLVNAVYQNLFGRPAEVAGLTYWVGQLDNGALKIGNIAEAINKGSQGTDADIIANKVTAATAFTNALDTNAEIVAYASANDTALNAVKTWLNTVTSDAASVTVATGAPLDNVLNTVQNNSNENAGQTFTLTEAVQSLVGTGGNDTFIAGVTGGAAGGATLTAGDKVDGGAGTDTIELYGNANAGAFATAQVSNVEIVKAQVAAAGATALNVAGNAGVQQAWVVAGSNGANTVTLTKAQVAGLQGAVGTTATPGAVTFAFSNATAAAGDVASLNLNAANTAAGGSVIINAIEALNVSATGANRLGTLTNDSLQTLNIAGEGSVNATVAGNTLRTVDASTNTGGITLNVAASAAAAAVQTIKGGSGDDTITTTWGGLTNTDKIDLGAGKDALIFTDAVTAGTAAALGTTLAGVSNVEELGVNGAVALTVDAALVSNGINTYSIQTNGASAALTNVNDATTLVAKDGAFAASTAALKLGAHTLNLELAGSTTAASDFTNGLTVTGSSIINVVSKGTSGVATNELALAVADNNTINVSGSQNLVLTVNGATGTTGKTIKADGFTGILIASGTGQADAITGGSGNDIITGSVLTNAQATAAIIDWTAGALGASGADTLAGGAGNDTFGFAAATVGLTNVSTITDFAKGDSLVFGLGANAGSFVATAVNVSSAANLADAVGLADNTADNISWFVYQGNTYVVAAGATAAAVTDDTIVKLTGVLDLSGSVHTAAATGDVLTFA